MGVQVHQLASDSHHKNILASLHQLRVQGQLCDVTVQVDYQGEVQVFQAHQVILAASSGYFKNILSSQDATKDKLVLSNMESNDFSKFLEFVYTGTVKVAKDKIGDVQAVAQLLDCKSLSEVCGEALSGGVLQKPRGRTCASKLKPQAASGSPEKGEKTKGKKQPKSSFLKRQLSPQSAEKDEILKKRLKVKNIQRSARLQGKKLNLKLAGRKMIQRHWYCSSREKIRENQVRNEDREECGNGTEDDARPENKKDKMEEASLVGPSSDVDEWGGEDEVHSLDPRDPLFLLEAEGEEEGQFKRKRPKPSKAQFQCNKCLRTFHYEKSYLKHISTYHGVKADVVYRCEICQQTFANRSNLKIHEKHVHSNERLFECEACAKTFKRKKDVVRHKRQVHERNLQHVCPDCGKTLSSKAALLLHERTHTGTKPYECPQCKARFSQNSALKMHQRTHTGEKPFACDECDARFTQKHMLAYHKRSHTGEKPFMCEACGKSFASKEYLKHHSNIHTGSKPYKCDKCERGFAQRNSLNQHLKIHTGERPYKCKDCDKQFTQINALQRHQRIHTGEKPFMCVLCKRAFSDKSTLRRHTLVHDTDAPWKTYLVVLEGNIEEKKPRSPTEENAEKVESGEKMNPTGESPSAAGAAPAVSTPAASSASDADTTQTETTMVSTESVTLPSDWTSHGAIALVSHGALGGITVFHTEVPAGTQIQPIIAANSTGTSVISIDGSAIPVPFSIPVSMTQPGSLSSEASPTSLSLPTLSVPVSDTLLASVSGIPTVSTSSVLEAAASQAILASALENKSNSETETLPPDIQTVVVGNDTTGKEQTNVPESDGQHETAGDPLVEPKYSTVQDTD